MNENQTIKPAIQTDTMPNQLALLPLKNVVIMPKSIIPIMVGRPSSIKAVEYALKQSQPIFITAQKDPHVEMPLENDLYQYGTQSTILQVMRMPNGSLKLLAEGMCRARITHYNSEGEFATVDYQTLSQPDEEISNELHAWWRQLKELYIEYAQLNEKVPTDIFITIKNVIDVDYSTDAIAAQIKDLSFDDRQKLLEIVDLKERIITLCSLLTKEIEISETEELIKGQVQNQVEKNQREYYLNEQMKAIAKELGRDEQSGEIAQMKEKVKKLKMSEEATEKAHKELRRLEQMQPMSPEAGVCRNYIDWLTSLPWNKESRDTISISQAEKILNKKHAGLIKAKERIIEFLAAKKFSKSLHRAPIICLVGPPGVGKTSMASSVAESLGREFVRISLGGVKDEAEVRGHRRTYIGSLPGKIIQSMRKAKTVNPVILLDEIDKMSRDMHGDPASALLEVLDPEQNKTFVDHFLDCEYDLSKVMFITTANMLDGIPYPLFDRMEIISISGYTEDEKVTIATKFLIPKNLGEYSLTKQQFTIKEDMLRIVISQYTKESGVRQLERTIAKLMRKAIQVLLKEKKSKKITIDAHLIKEWLGNPKFKKTSLNETEKQTGLATGLAWTELGGDMLEIETSVLPGKGSVTLTGQLGEVMQESAQAALSYIRSRVKELGIPASFYANRDIHVHIPEGATPKDGPSAGITMCASLISSLLKKPLKPHLAMTGEITLQGRVLSVGGLKEKLLAAQQHGMKSVIVPHENKDDIQEILKEVDLGTMKLIYAKSMDEVLNEIFEKIPMKKPRKKVKKSISA